MNSQQTPPVQDLISDAVGCLEHLMLRAAYVDLEAQTGFSEVLRRLCEQAPALREHRERFPMSILGSTLAVRTYGYETTTVQPILITLGEVALHLHPLVTHRLTPELCELVDDTDLHTLPIEPPRLLRGAWLAEAAPGEVLFGSTIGLAGYAAKDKIVLVGLLHGKQMISLPWRPRWTGQDISDDGFDPASVAMSVAVNSGLLSTTDRLKRIFSDEVLNIDDQAGAWTEWGKEAARFITIFSMLRDAENTPIRVNDTSDRPQGQGRRDKKHKPPPAWVTRYVSLCPRAIPLQTLETEETTEGHPRSPNLETKTVQVKGHIRYVPSGPGRTKRKCVYVEKHTARRWITPGPRHIVVSP